MGSTLRIIAFTIVGSGMPLAPACADTFVVTSTANAGPGSLRQAMLDANARQVTNGAACARHTIEFNIAGAGPHTIRPTSALPRINIPIDFNGYSQPGASVNTLFRGSNAVIQIEIDGSLAGNVDAFVVGSFQPGVVGALCPGSNSWFRGLAINRWGGSAISMGEEGCPVGQSCPVGGLLIIGNHIGTDVTGAIALGNGAGSGRPALLFGESSTFNIVGAQIVEDGGSQVPEPLTRNVISGNAADAIAIISPRAGSSALGNRIRNNYIGLNAQGSAMLPNGGRGVVVGINSDGTRIHDNLVAGNAGDGVVVAASASSTSVLGNGVGIGLAGLALGNGGNGIRVLGTSRGVVVAGRYPFVSESAAIAHNAGAGVLVDGTATADLASISASDNAGLEIDLAPPGVNANDAGDPDDGPNELLNHPTIVSAAFDSSSFTGSISATLNATPNTSGISIHYFFNDSCDPSGSGGGQAQGSIPISSVVPTTDAQGNASSSVATGFLPVGRFLTAVARKPAATPGSLAFVTSEFSPCVPIVAASPLLFMDGFE